MTTSLEDIVNMDMLGLTNELSDNDQSSPDSAFLAMPPTPPQPAVDPANVAELFKFYFDQHMTELQKQQQQTQPLPFSFGSPLFAQPTQTSQQPDPNFFAIDPALMNTVSSTSKAANVAAASKAAAARSASSVAGDDEDEELLDEDDDDIEQFLARPVKVGGRGKAAGRKGTISAGGIKKFGGQAVKDSDDPEDWRPTVEQYKKMTPKEKRQLRNKISARNFRVRRKEYITTLEGDVAERDKLIDLIRDELGATKLENESLKREVDALKKALLEGRVELDLPPPGPLSPATNASSKRTTRSALAKPNTRKDVARSGSSFWGGVAGAGGVAQVHTTLVPDFSFDDIQENMNPALNAACRPDAMVNSICEPMAKDSAFDQFTDNNPFTMRSLDQYRMQMWGRLAREAGPGTLNAALGLNAASAFGQQQQSPSAGSTPSPRSTVPGLLSSPSLSSNSSHSSPSPPPMFPSSLLPLQFTQSYGGEQLGINGQPLQTMPHPILSPSASPLSGHAANARPLFLSPMHRDSAAERAAPSPTLSELVGTKPKQASSSSNLAASAKPEHAILATMASQTLLTKMRDAFWDAFAGPSTKKDWDADKVRRVLDGTAVVRVVDVEPEQKTVEDPAAALEESMRALTLQRNSLATVQMQTGGKKDVAATNAGVDALTGVFSGLRLARTGTARS